MRHPLQGRDYALIVVAAIGFVAVWYFLGVRIQLERFIDTPQARLQRARDALLSGEDAAAMQIFEPLAKSGNARAQFWVADMYEHGYGVKKNVPVALDWLKKAADQGFVRADARLGQIYLDGNETLQDFTRAKTWLTRAAMKGDAVSERHVGQIYAAGLGVPRDQIEAYAWYENAAVNGDRFAMRLRDELVGRMTPDEIAKAQTRAKELWRAMR
jgi:TPR repeat protein